MRDVFSLLSLMSLHWEWSALHSKKFSARRQTNHSLQCLYHKLCPTCPRRSPFSRQLSVFESGWERSRRLWAEEIERLLLGFHGKFLVHTVGRCAGLRVAGWWQQQAKERVEGENWGSFPQETKVASCFTLICRKGNQWAENDHKLENLIPSPRFNKCTIAECIKSV